MPRRALGLTEGEKGSNRARQDYPKPTPDTVVAARDFWLLSNCNRLVTQLTTRGRLTAPGPLALVGAACNDDAMAKTVIVKLTDDLDGSDADETVSFALDGRTYEIDLSAAHAVQLRDAVMPFAQKARVSGARSGGSTSRPPRSTAGETMYSQLHDEEKARFRSWANMATARRISDARVKSWIAAGKP